MSAVISDAPASNAEVFREYHSYVKYLIARYGFAEDFVEDMTSIIFEKLIKNDVLADYNPEFSWEAYGKERTASFRTFLSGFVVKYLYHYKVRENRRADMEPMSIDYTVRGDDGSEEFWLDVHGQTAVNDLETTESMEIIHDIRRRIKDAKPTRVCTMDEFFSSVMSHVAEYGKVDIAALAAEYDVSDTTIQNWMKKLRQHVTAALS